MIPVQSVLRGLLSLSIIALTSCGGGGGGGGGSSSTTGVRVLHGAIDAAPVDLITDNSGVVQTVRYGEGGEYLSLGEGQHLLTLFRTKDISSSLFNRSVTNPGDFKFTLLFYGDRGSFGLRTTLIDEEAPEVLSGSGLVRVIDGMTGALSVNLTVGGKQENARFGAASAYVEVSPGEQSYIIRRAIDGLSVASGTLLVEEGRAYSIFLAGEQGYLVNASVLEE